MPRQAAEQRPSRGGRPKRIAWADLDIDHCSPRAGKPRQGDSFGAHELEEINRLAAAVGDPRHWRGGDLKQPVDPRRRQPQRARAERIAAIGHAARVAARDQGGEEARRRCRIDAEMGCRVADANAGRRRMLHDFQEIQSPADGADLRKVTSLSIHHWYAYQPPAAGTSWSARLVSATFASANLGITFSPNSRMDSSVRRCSVIPPYIMKMMYSTSSD